MLNATLQWKDTENDAIFGHSVIKQLLSVVEELKTNVMKSIVAGLLVQTQLSLK
jgi:hypothetical protein